MKTIVLQSLVIRNFKGIVEFSLFTKGLSPDVYGENGTGKTTLFDAFTWLLFDKDSQNKKDFQLKTVDENGKELHGLDHTVEATFLVNGTELVLKKVFKESWTKKRGQATAVFSGHSTDYYINEVPAKKGEYTKKIAELVEEEIFKLLTSPSYFNEQLHWQKRRELLLEISGDVSDREVISNLATLSGLLDIIEKRSIDEHKKMITAKRSEINKKLEFIPARIDEVRRGMADTRELDAEVIQKQIAGEQERIMEAKDELYRIQNGGAVQEKKQRLQEIEWKLKEGQQKHNEMLYAATEEIRGRMTEIQHKVNDVRSELRTKQSDLRHKTNQLATAQQEVNKLLENWYKENEQKFDHHSTTCPTCSQEFPEEHIQKAVENFNLNKARALETITKLGKDKAVKRDRLQNEIAELQNEIETLSKLETTLLNTGAETQDAVTKAKLQQGRYEDAPEYAELSEQKKQVEAEIELLKINAVSAANEVRQRINQMEYTIDTLKGELNKFSLNDQAKTRIAELEQEEKTLAEAFEQIEQELFLIEEFTRSKVKLLEEKINSKFKYARFKLFEEQINGGLQDTCKTLYNGVPYSEGLNNAARINVGLDIIQTLSHHFNVSVPIFVDNAEAVTKMLPIENQVIRLIVAKGEEFLRVETAGELEVS